MEHIQSHRMDSNWDLSTSGPCGHLVQFFQDDNDLSEAVGSFMTDCLKKGFGGIVIATGPHIQQVKEYLEKNDLNLNQLEKKGQLLLLDASETLSKILVNDLPDSEQFQNSIGKAIDNMIRKFKNVCAYGEMVGLLWDQENIQGTILLEQLWNRVLQEKGISLLCGYKDSQFINAKNNVHFDKICDEHHHIISMSSEHLAGNAGSYAKTITRLQQRERALQTEINERNRFEAAYRESEALKDAILDSSQDCIKVLDLNANIVFMNKGGLKNLEVSDFKEIEGKSWIDFWDKEFQKKALEAFQKALSGRGSEFNGPLPIPKKKKHTWWSVAISPIRNSQGKVVQVLAVSRDITAQIAAQEVAKKKVSEQNEEKFRLIVDSVRDYAIFMLDRQGKVSTWNKGAKNFKGYEAHEIIGQHFSIFYPEEDKNWKPAMELQIASLEGRFEDEGWRVRKDGSKFWANVVISAIFDQDKKLLGFSKVTRDLTERKQAEETRLKVEAQMREINAVNNERDRLFSIFMQVPTPIAVFRGPDHLIELFNPAARDFIGGKDPTGMKYREALPELQDVGIYEILDRVYQTGQPETQLSQRVELRQPDGSTKEYYFNILYEALRDKNGTIVGIFYLSLDVTDQIKAIQYRDEFLSIASHELKTPITTLKFQLQMFERDSKKGSQELLSSPRVTEKLTMMNSQIRKITGLLDDLLDMSHIQNRKMKFEFEEFDLCPLVQELSKRFNEEARSQGLKILVHSDCSIVGNWDRMRLEQVAANLISNAIKYGHSLDGGMESIKIYFEDLGDLVHLVVQDHGMGISEVDQERIFGRFERAVSARYYGGLGLGLFITKQIVEAHHGRIWVESKPKMGSKFIVELPKKPV